MNIVDLGIIVFILLGAFVGWKQGFTRSVVNCVGYTVIIIVAFLLKNPIGDFMMMYLPFFDFFGLIKGLSVLNIAVYQVFAFLLIFMLLTIVLKFLMIATKFFETILKFTIILGVPSKILGAILGLIKNYVIAFMILYILSLPIITGTSFLEKSKFTEPILASTPILSMFADNSMKVASEFTSLTKKYDESTSNEFNLETLDLFLKYDVVKVSTVNKLIEKGKIKIDGSKELLEKYEEE